MANKKYMQQRIEMEKEKKLLMEKKKLRFLPLISFFLAILLLILMLVHWAAIDNETVGIEVRISGFNCVASGLSGNYTSADSAFGDMAAPFNYYAASYVKKLCAVTVVVFFLSIVRILIELFATISNKHGAFDILSIIFGILQFVFFTVCYAFALTMNDSQILPGYCNSNPECSIISQAILPALFSLFSLALPIVGIIRTRKLKKQTV